MAVKGLSFDERAHLVQALRHFVKSNPELEDETGYSEGYYMRLLDDFLSKGTPEDADAQNSLEFLIFAAYIKT